ncbi:Endoglucanase 5 precursor [compost metagenome]
MTLAWVASTSATSYNVKQAINSGGPYTTIASGITGNGYVHNGLINGTTYHYVVTAVNANGESSNSTEVDATPLALSTAPSAPSNVTATAGDSTVTLSWTASSGATSYNVNQATASGRPYTTIATNVTATSYVNNGLSNGVTYYYVVTAVNTNGESGASSEVSAQPVAGPIVSGLVLQYRAGDTNVNDNTIKPLFNIKNTGTTAISLSDLKIRYYFTNEGTASLNSWVDYAQIGGENVQRTFETLTGTNADTYVELSFSSSAGTLQPGSQTGEIQLRIHKADWTVFNEGNDYSFDSTKTSYSDWNKITLYKSGTLVWGLEP